MSDRTESLTDGIPDGPTDSWGVVLRRDVVESGLTDAWLRRMVQQGHLVRMRQGAYASAQSWVDADKVRRHLMLTSAVVRQYDGRLVAVSHTSAALLYGAPDWGHDLTRVHLTSLLGTSERNQAKVVHHRGVVRVGDVSRREGFWVTSPARTALDAACLLPREAAVCLVDWFLHSGLTTRAELDAMFVSMKEWPDTLGLWRVLDLCDGRSESVGETRTRLMVRDQGLPAPELQWVVHDRDGRFVGRVDLAWPEHGLILEFDGRVKYREHLRPGESIEDAVLREKAREDRLREATGFAVIRITWRDLADPVGTCRRIRALMRGIAA